LEKNKRTQHVVDRAFQMQVATRLTAIALLVPIVLLLGGYLVWTFGVMHRPTLANEPFGWTLARDLLKDQWWLILFFFVVFVAFSFALVFYNTHRIAGPVYRFRWLFDELAEGRVHTRVQLREGDSFENLASTILRANATLASSITQLKDAAAALKQEADKLQNQALAEQVSTLNRVLDRFSITELSGTGEEPENENRA
jgi:hypothetical protein